MSHVLRRSTRFLPSLALVAGCAGSGSGNDAGVDANSTGGDRNPVCAAGESQGEVQAPLFLYNLPGETGWFASPVVSDLEGDGANELVVAQYSLFVYDSDGKLLAQAKEGLGRVYAPHVVADLDADGTTEIVVGNDHQVIAYEWLSGTLAVKAGWP
ncbi:MAG: VCBS repeat-containing protein, partial [Deltaproteobacteria bacterium]|nr:VCBS repeat-containing protein [Deltaproteobacteria bacterium]